MIGFYNMTVTVHYKDFPTISAEKNFTVEIYKDCPISVMTISEAPFN